MKNVFQGLLCCLTLVYTVQAQRVLYGTTTYGGKENGVGVLFSFNLETHAYTDLVDFDDANGAFPSGTLVQAGDGKLYGMTMLGGNMREGAIFSYNPVTGVYANVFNFGGSEGGQPMGNGLVKASNGKLYGLTNGGVGNGINVLFSFDPATAIYTKLFDFSTQLKGISPVGSLIQAKEGKLYGMTEKSIFSFELTANTYTTLFSFSGTNGDSPTGSLLQASNGKLYGTTRNGGTNGYGVLFSFDPVTSDYTKLVDFENTNYPVGSLIQARNGNLYGVTSFGGIFSFDPVTAVYTGVAGIESSTGTLVQASDGKLYGMTEYGGKTDDYYASEGVIFSFDPVTNKLNQEWDFDYRTGGTPAQNEGMVEYKPVVISRKDQAITFEAIPDQAPGDSLVTLTVTTSSGLPVILSVVSGPATLSGDTLTIKGGGSITVRASQQGNKDYNPAPNVDRTFCALSLWYRDADGDGYGNGGRSKIACSKPNSYVSRRGDWNDYDAVIYPGAPELCDGRDNDQNGKIDDGLTQRTFYWDHDKDGYGFRRPIYACAAPRGYIEIGGDCNDNDSSVHPGTPEIRGNGVDDNCNGVIDEGAFQEIVDCPADIIVNSEVGKCGAEVSWKKPFIPALCPTVHRELGPGFTFIGSIDGHDYYTSIATYRWQDAKMLAITLGGHLATITSQEENNFIFQNGISDSTIEENNSLQGYWIGLNDNAVEGTFVWSTKEPVTFTNWDEGQPDNNASKINMDRDADHVEMLPLNGKWDDFDFFDSWPLKFVVEFEPCVPATLTQTSLPATGLHNGSFFPVGTTIITYQAKAANDVVTTCTFKVIVNSQAEDDCKITTWYRDADGDGWGNPASSVDALTQPKGYVSNSLDCNDKNKFKGGPEVCDGIDNDCDGVIDNGFDKKAFYSDLDGDGWGTAKRMLLACTAPPHYVSNSEDCNDDNGKVYPGAPELCDGRDNNCNGIIDESFEKTTFYYDFDKDGYGNPDITLQGCAAPRNYVTLAGDCNDWDASIHPGAKTLCNGKDNNCDGLIDAECNNVVTQGKEVGKIINEKGLQLQLTAAPNPSSQFFTLHITSNSSNPIILRIIDEVGRVVEARQGVAVNSTIIIGQYYRPGTYFARVVQGGEQVHVKLVKQTP
jgi:uncharacterized repeat protein (TIGR03803 family)